jgi:hypothetical protein
MAVQNKEAAEDLSIFGLGWVAYVCVFIGKKPYVSSRQLLRKYGFIWLLGVFKTNYRIFFIFFLSFFKFNFTFFPFS